MPALQELPCICPTHEGAGLCVELTFAAPDVALIEFPLRVVELYDTITVLYIAFTTEKHPSVERKQQVLKERLQASSNSETAGSILTPRWCGRPLESAAPLQTIAAAAAVVPDCRYRSRIPIEKLLSPLRDLGICTTAAVPSIARIVITYSKTKDQSGKVANPARGQLNMENESFPVPPFAPENLVSQDGFGSPVPRRPAHLHTQAESGAYLRNSSRVPRRRLFICLNRRMPSGQSRVIGSRNFVSMAFTAESPSAQGQ